MLDKRIVVGLCVSMLTSVRLLLLSKTLELIVVVVLYLLNILMVLLLPAALIKVISMLRKGSAFCFGICLQFLVLVHAS